jgi:hypothetical protein
MKDAATTWNPILHALLDAIARIARVLHAFTMLPTKRALARNAKIFAFATITCFRNFLHFANDVANFLAIALATTAAAAFRECLLGKATE